MTSGRVFVDTTYGYRNWRVAVFVLPFGTMGVFLLWQIIRAMANADIPVTAKEWGGAAVSVVLTVVFLWIAGWLLLAAIMNRRERARIDERGIQTGSKLLPWERVRFIAGSRSGRGYQLHIGVKRGLDRHFWIGRSWTPGEYDALREELDAFLAEEHPEIGLGG